MKNIIIGLTLGLLAAGCILDQETIDAACKVPNTAYIFESGIFAASNIIANDSSLAREINTWLLNNRDDWKFDINTYYPDTLVDNDYIRLNIQKSRVILSIKGGDSWTQYSRAIEPIHLKWKNEIKKMSEQTGPGYPPQSVGSPDP